MTPLEILGIVLGAVTFLASWGFALVVLDDETTAFFWWLESLFLAFIVPLGIVPWLVYRLVKRCVSADA